VAALVGKARPELPWLMMLGWRASALAHALANVAATLLALVAGAV
jgi:hypothetical protein